MDLQDTFYIIGIVYMSLGTLLMIALVIAVFVIKAKINEIHNRIEEKLRFVNQVADFGEKIVHKAEEMAERHRR